MYSFVDIVLNQPINAPNVGADPCGRPGSRPVFDEPTNVGAAPVWPPWVSVGRGGLRNDRAATRGRPYVGGFNIRIQDNDSVKVVWHDLEVIQYSSGEFAFQFEPPF